MERAMMDLGEKDTVRSLEILSYIKENGVSPRLRDGDRFHIAYMIAEDIISWEEDPMGNLMHLTHEGHEWFKEEQEYRNRMNRPA